MHLDMDAFFASVEQMDNPDLRGKPVIIGGRTRGVVATASYEARSYGIHSAMPMATARRLCPHGEFVRARGARYSEISRAIFVALNDFSPLVEAASIDEAYLDVSGSLGLYGSFQNLAECLAGCVARASGGLTCSIGIAPVKFLAKICSEVRKPGGVFILEAGAVADFLGALPIERLPGVGKRMAASLHGIGIRTTRELRELSRDFLVERYGKWGGVLHDRGNGIDPRPVHVNLPAKSESVESTFPVDIIDREQLCKALLAHSEKLGSRLRRKGLEGRTITLKIKYADFSQITRSHTISFHTHSTSVIYANARALLLVEPLRGPVRLVGVGVSGFDRKGCPLLLPGLQKETASEQIDKAVDLICARYGRGAIQRGAAFSRN
ncbi:MAG: DNA polymerase IV [Desulfovibrio sp.]|nr:DNA polymerase IV [Desulfovibrio sp.]